MKIELPEKVKTVIAELKAHGYDAYAVGGCIRDSILGRTPGDWDITTSAKPHQVKAIFSTNRGHRDPAWYRDSFDG